MDRSSLLKKLSKILSPSGILTVSSQSEKAQLFLKKWYQSTSFEEAQATLTKRLESLSKKNVALLGYPCDNGAGLERGSKFGPMEIRETYATYYDYPNEVIDIGDIWDHPLLVHDSLYQDWVLDAVYKDRYQGSREENFPISPLSLLEESIQIMLTLNPKLKIITLGGDHSLSFVPVEAYAKLYPGNLAVIHFDAHSDLLVDRNGLPFSYASWAHRANQAIGQKQSLMQIGIRQSIYSKEYWEKQEDVKQLWSKEVLSLGPKETFHQIEKHLSHIDKNKIYLSIDIDVLCSSEASATGTPSEGGLHPKGLLEIVQKCKEKFDIVGADIVEVAPTLSKQHVEEPQRTLKIASDLLNVLL